MDLACSWKIACSGGGTLVKSNWEKYQRYPGEKQLRGISTRYWWKATDRRQWRNARDQIIDDILEKSSPDTEVVCPGQPDWCAGGRAWSWVWVVRGVRGGWLGPRHGVGPRPPNTTISPTPEGESSQMYIVDEKLLLCQESVRCWLTSGSVCTQLLFEGRKTNEDTFEWLLQECNHRWCSWKNSYDLTCTLSFVCLLGCFFHHGLFVYLFPC